MAESETERDEEREFRVGDEVHDTDDDDPSAGYVVKLPEPRAEEWTAYGKTTVAESNPEYPSDAQVVVVVYENKMHHISEWDRSTPLERSEIREAGAKPYSFPAPRIAHGHIQSSSDPDAPETEETTVEMDALDERLSGADWEVHRDGDDLIAERWGETYRVEPGGEIEGDGDLRNPLETLVSNYAE